MAADPRRTICSFAQCKHEEGGPAGGSVLPLPLQLLEEKADPGSLVLLVPAGERVRVGSKGRKKGWARDRGRPTISHQVFVMLSSQ